MGGQAKLSCPDWVSVLPRTQHRLALTVLGILQISYVTMLLPCLPAVAYPQARQTVTEFYTLR